jgi:hypothetical protein
MRFIQTFVVRLYVDSEEADRLCGNFRMLSDSQLISFKNPTEFILLLRQCISQTPDSPVPHLKLEGDD